MTITTQQPNANKALWEKGDFTKIAETMRESGAALVAKLGVQPGMQVLDIGCGDGTTAIPLANIAGKVLGFDIAGNLVAAGNNRVQQEGLSNIVFQEGDATNMPELATSSFDMTVSIFGVMFAPKPFDVARELVRVTKPGGTIIMGNWIPGDPTLVAQILKISSAYTPPPPEGFISPMLWGVRSNVTERFAAAGIPEENIHFSEEIFTFNANYSPAAFVQTFKNYYGPTMNAFEAAEKNGKANQLQVELEELFTAHNQSGSTDKTSIPARFLLVKLLR